MKNIGTQQLETERFILRRFVEEDYHAMYHNWAKHEECARYFPWNPMTDINIAREKMSKWVQNYAREDYYHWGIIELQQNFLREMKHQDESWKNVE